MSRSKRSTVLDNATALFIEHGFSAVGIEAVINASGVARMTMYRNFSSKDALVEAVLRERSAGLLVELNKEVLAKRTMMTRIKAIFDWHEDWYQSEMFHGCLFERVIDRIPAPSRHPRSRACLQSELAPSDEEYLHH